MHLPREELVLHENFVRNLAHRLVQDPHLADDVAQEACLIALEKGPRSKDLWRPWIRRVVENLLQPAQARDHKDRSARSSEREISNSKTAGIEAL